MAAAVTVMTPQEAARLLACNGHNRNVSEVLVERYARDMRCGAWKQNGEPILVARDGTLLDGQHRLLAIQRAGRPQTLLVPARSRTCFPSVATGATRPASWPCCATSPLGSRWDAVCRRSGMGGSGRAQGAGGASS